jgi:hypothetical protein
MLLANMTNFTKIHVLAATVAAPGRSPAAEAPDPGLSLSMTMQQGRV